LDAAIAELARRDLQSRVDAIYDVARVILEADGRRWHVRVDQMANDRRRDRAAMAHGYWPYRFVYQELKYEPDVVIETVRDALAAYLPRK
jgi:very-short-patch-repair endonuclease